MSGMRSLFGRTSRKNQKRQGRQTNDSRARRLAYEPLEDRRLLFAGELDLSFGGDGFANVPDIRALDMALQPDGKVVVVGSKRIDGFPSLAVGRYNSDGSLDTSFSSDGVDVIDFVDAYSEANAVALQPDGKILVAGHIHTSGPFDTNFAIVRYNSDGTLDSSFGFFGVVTTSLGADFDVAYDVLVQNDGKIVVVGSSGNTVTDAKFALVRYNGVDGSLDTTFGNGGIVTTIVDLDGANARGAALQSDGKIIAVGTSNNLGSPDADFVAVRYNSNGSVDGTFGSSGTVNVDLGSTFEGATSVAVQADGRIILAGITNFETGADIALLRLQTNGAIDGSFGNAGTVITDLQDSELGGSILLQPDGKILVGSPGNFFTSGRPLLVRYNANGSLDASFGTNGVVTIHSAPSAGGASLALQPDGKILIAGGGNFEVARFFGDAQTTVALVGPSPAAGYDLVIKDVRFGGKDDKLKLSYVNGKIRIEDLNGTYITALVGTGNNTPVVEVDPALITNNSGEPGDIRLETLGGTNRVVIDSSLAAWGKTIYFDQYVSGTDTVRVEDAGGASSVVAGYYGVSRYPELVVDGSLTIQTGEYGVVDVTGFANVTFPAPQEPGGNVLYLSPALDAFGGTAPAMRLTHPHFGGEYRLFNNQTVVVDATAPSNLVTSIQVVVALSAAIGNQNLTLRSSLSSALGAASPVEFSHSVSVSGTLTVDSPKVDLRAPLFAAAIIGNATTVNVGGTGQIQQAIALAAATAAVNVQPGTYAGSVNTAGKSITLSPGSATGRVNIIGSLNLDANDTLDLQINGGNPATQFDNFTVLGAVSLGGATLSLSGSHTPVENLTLISNDQSFPVGGAFAAPYFNGANVTINGAPMTLIYTGGDGNDVVLIDVGRPIVDLVSVAGEISDSAGGEAGMDVSADGRYVAFVSSSPNLVAGVTLTANIANVYRLDRQTGQIVLVSAALGGLSGGNLDSTTPQISDDGNVVAFTSQASNLHPLKTSSSYDVFVRKIGTSQTLLASVNSGGSGSGNGISFAPALSANGQRVAYWSRATNLYPLDTNTFSDIFAFNVASGANTLVSINKTNNGSGNGDSQGATISADGNVIAYWSSATNLHPLDTNAAIYQDVFARNLTTSTTHLVTINQAGTGSTPVGAIDPVPVISANGNVIAFRSYAVGLEPVKTDSTIIDIFARNIATGVTKLVSINKDNDGGANYLTYQPVVNADGTVVAYTSGASNLHAADTNPLSITDVFARNLTTNSTSLVASGNNISFAPVISSNGNLVAFHSLASLSPLDTNPDTYEVYLRNLSSGALTLVSTNDAGTAAGNAESTAPVISADGSVVAFSSFATDLTPLVDENGFGDLFLYNVGSGNVELGSKRAASLPSKSAGEASFTPAATSADGRYIAFVSAATNIVPGINDPNDYIPYTPPTNVYRYDRLTGDVVLVSVSSDGLSYGAGGSPVISADGSIVAFTSLASNLHPLDNNQTQDVFARNLNTNTTYLVSISSVGNSSGDNISFAPTISADGNVVAFASYASNLHALDSNGTALDIFARNLATNTTHLISVNSANNGSGNGESGDNHSGKEISLNSDGSVVAFSSYATNLHPLDTDPARDIFARHLITGTTSLISINKNSNGGGNLGSFQPAMSADGNVVAFNSYASNLHSLDVNSTIDVFVRNLAAGVTSLVSVNRFGTAGGNFESYNPILSADGSVVAYESVATDLHPLDNNPPSVSDIFARNLITNTTHLISVGSAGSGNANSTAPSISANGKVVVFESFANNLHSADSGSNSDIFVRNIEKNTTRLVSMIPSGSTSGNEVSFTPTVSADGRVIVFGSHATNLVAGDFNRWPDIFLATLLNGPPLAGDFDGNGVVDDGDYDVWTANFGSTVTPGTRGDANGDGVVDAADYTVWRDHLGQMNPGSGAASTAEEPNVASAIADAAVASFKDIAEPATLGRAARKEVGRPSDNSPPTIRLDANSLNAFVTRGVGSRLSQADTSFVALRQDEALIAWLATLARDNRAGDANQLPEVGNSRTGANAVDVGLTTVDLAFETVETVSIKAPHWSLSTLGHHTN